MNNTFKAIIATAALITLAGASATASAHGRFGLNIMIGAPAYAYAPPPAYAYAPAPAYAYAPPVYYAPRPVYAPRVVYYREPEWRGRGHAYGRDYGRRGWR